MRKKKEKKRAVYARKRKQPPAWATGDMLFLEPWLSQATGIPPLPCRVTLKATAPTLCH